jgi:hypothetical protein
MPLSEISWFGENTIKDLYHEPSYFTINWILIDNTNIHPMWFHQPFLPRSRHGRTGGYIAVTAFNTDVFFFWLVIYQAWIDQDLTIWEKKFVWTLQNCISILRVLPQSYKEGEIHGKSSHLGFHSPERQNSKTLEI